MARFSDSGSVFVPDGDFNYGDECTYEGRYLYADVVSSGRFKSGRHAAIRKTALLVLETFREGEDTPNLVLFQLPSEAELPVLRTVLDTFDVSR